MDTAIALLFFFLLLFVVFILYWNSGCGKCGPTQCCVFDPAMCS